LPSHGLEPAQEFNESTGVTRIGSVNSLYGEVYQACLRWKLDAQKCIKPFVLSEWNFLMLLDELAVGGSLKGSKKFRDQDMLSFFHSAS